MPTENEPMDLSKATLYIRPPEGGDPVPFPRKLASLPPTKTPTIPAGIEAAFGKVAEITTEIVIPVFNELWRVVLEAGEITRWAMRNRPRLVHLALRAKKARTRKKNRERMVREYYREVAAP